MNDQQIMRECFRLAMRGKGSVSPNPMVGAVLVKDGRIVARGYHKNFGGPHAEAECLRHATQDVRDATLYVNLEPCSYYGKTPPCTELILSRGIKKVVAAMKDPNPQVAGRGFGKLQRAGVQTSVGLLESEAKNLNRAFGRHITTRRPYVHMKIAQSRDARISGGPSRWISSLESRKRVHAMRSEYDAVLVGAGTVRTDNPSLTVRLVHGRDPDVVILDGAFSVSATKRVFASGGKRRILLMTTIQAARRNPSKARLLAAKGVIVLALKGEGGRLRPRDVLRELYERNIASVLIEGGGHVFTEFLKEGLVDELTLFVARGCFGDGLSGIDQTQRAVRRRLELDGVRVGRSGSDLMVNVLFK